MKSPFSGLLSTYVGFLWYEQEKFYLKFLRRTLIPHLVVGALPTKRINLLAPVN